MTAAHRPSTPVSAADAARLVQAGRLDAAAAMCRAILERDPADAAALQVDGLVEERRGRFDEAVGRYEAALRQAPRAPALLCAIGRARRLQGRYEDAAHAYERVLGTDPDHAAATIGLAEVRERQGRLDDARALVEPRARGGRDPDAAMVLALLEERAGAWQRAVDVLEPVTRGDAPGSARPRLLFTLGRAHERLGEIDAAMDAYHRANAIARPPYDARAARARHDRIRAVWSADAIAALPRAPALDPGPVLIVGMPRCGSTLVDQILAAHPATASAGESDALPRLLGRLAETAGAPYPDGARALDAQGLATLQQRYLERARAQANDPDGRALLIDKHLGTYAHLGFAAMVLPGARIIHCRRNPLSTCLSCYTTALPLRPHPWAADLYALGRAYALYEHAMAHWAQVLDLPRLDIDYEALCTDQEAESRRLVEFCGLPWDDACLRFHEVERDVATASYDQVRRSMYTSSVARHERFRGHLDPLEQGLREGRAENATR